MTEETMDVSKLSFEQALDQLEQIVDRLERGDVALDESIKIYDQGEALKKHCAALLKAAEDKVEKIRIGADGTAKGTEALD
ncbi:MAG: exodeoxyribonuclease VII small subunit [Rhizobiaceae bacterium]